MKDTWGLRAVNTANDHENLIKGRYNPLVCQCCGYRKERPEDPECICDGLDWYQTPSGAVECQAHRFARLVDAPKSTFVMADPEAKR